MKDRKALLSKTVLPMCGRVKCRVLSDWTENEKYMISLGCPMGWN